MEPSRYALLLTSLNRPRPTIFADWPASLKFRWPLPPDDPAFPAPRTPDDVAALLAKFPPMQQAMFASIAQQMVNGCVAGRAGRDREWHGAVPIVLESAARFAARRGGGLSGALAAWWAACRRALPLVDVATVDLLNEPETPAPWLQYSRETMTMLAADSLDRHRRLRTAIDGLYAAFRPYKCPQRMQASPTAGLEESDHKRMRRPLLSLTASDFQKYVARAMTTWGDSHNFKYFLPRILELIAEHAEIFSGGIDTLEKLNYAGWRFWQPVERNAVDRFLTALWHSRMGIFSGPVDSHSPTKWPLRDCLCIFAELTDDRARWTESWLADGSATAALHLAMAIIESVPPTSHFDALRPQYPWRNPQPAFDSPALDWLDDRRAMAALVAVGTEFPAEPFTEMVVDAFNLLHEFFQHRQRARAAARH